MEHVHADKFLSSSSSPFFFVLFFFPHVHITNSILHALNMSFLLFSLILFWLCDVCSSSWSHQTCPRLASLGRQPCIKEEWAGIIVHKVLHLTGCSNHLLRFIHPLIDLLLTLYGWWIMISFVLPLITLQILKLLYHTVHVFPQLMTRYHGVK